MFFDSTYIIFVLPAIILAMYAQAGVSSAFNKYSKVSNSRGYTGADVAKVLLNNSGIYDVRVETTAGNLTDHYDPRSKVLRLSQQVYSSTSIAAIGVAAHETGHAVQHAQGYIPLSLRSALVPMTNISSKMAMPLIFIGIVLGGLRNSPFGLSMIYVGIILFAVAVVFSLVTLPVEFNASSRAVALLQSNHIVEESEVTPVKKVLRAAAMTYIASAIVSIANLLRFIVLANGSRRN